MVLVAAAGVWAAVISATLVRAQDTSGKWTEFLPPGNGKAVAETTCVRCHDLKGTVQIRQPRAEWEAVVIDMVGRGAPMSIEEADQAIAYLAEVFGPDAPPFTDANTATRDDLVRLPGVTAEMADRLIAQRTAKGPLVSRGEVRVALGMEEAAFDKVQWYIRAEGPTP